MFRVEELFRLDLPPELETPDCAGHFCIAEVVGDRPMWLARVYVAAQEDGPDLSQTFLVDHVMNAVEFAHSEVWKIQDLYVLLPPHIAHADGLKLFRCERIVECDEPDEMGICWRVEFSDLIFLDSAIGTAIGGEAPQRVIWQARPVGKDGS